MQSAQSSNSQDALVAAATASVQHTLSIINPNSSTNLNQQQITTTTTKREKQRPESWNKAEQQIFFNALRQVN